jgi:hypothetical protein
MAITEVVTPASSRWLTTLDTVKNKLGITVLTDDKLLTQLIHEASAQIETITGRFFPQERVKETLPGQGLKRLMLSRLPIDTVHSVNYNSDTIDDYTVEDKEKGFLYRDAGWIWTTGVWWGVVAHRIPGEEDQKFEINYTGGYVTPQMVVDDNQLTRDLPYDIEKACIQLVKEAYIQRDRDESVESERIGDYSVKYGSHSISPETLGLLTSWIDVL